MTRAKISEYSATAGDNTDVNGVNIAEGCPPSSMNNMGREIMAALKRFQVGSDGDGVTVGGQLAVTGTTTTSPAIVAAGDTNTGIFFPAADTIALATNGVERAKVGNSETVFNDGGADVDFRVEGDTNANLLFVDASTDRVGIGTSSPSDRLHVYQNAVDNILVQFQNAATNGGNLLQFSQVTNGSVAAPIFYIGHGGDNTGDAVLINASNTAMKLYTNNAERMRIDSSGNVIAATSNATLSHKLSKGSALGRFQLQVGESFPVNFYEGNGYGFNVAATLLEVSVNNVTSRSINAGGTINASGTDYAEYMTKAGEFELAKGDVCGVNADGKLTNIFADAVAFVVKSTNPSYVGGDTWGSNQTIGNKPEKPIQRAAEVDEEGNETQAAETDEDFAARQAQYETDLAEFEAKLEAERQKVDRIAFSGQVPVNVTGATAGQYIVPVENNGGITGVAVDEADMTLAQYMKAVGKVIAIEEDGRARIIVKVA